jgi:RNA polymerase sigma-70 factor (ECF subfamily)
MTAIGMSAEQLRNLIERGAQGEEAACAALYRQFSPLVMRLCLGLLGDLQDAEEVTQDAFVYALRNLRRFDTGRSAFPTWLYTIALSRCRNKRRRKLLIQMPLELLSAETPKRQERLVEAVLARRGVREQVWQVLQELRPHLREAVALRYLGEMRYKEIGETLGCNPKTAESRVRLGLDQLRRALWARGVERELDLVDQWA